MTLLTRWDPLRDLATMQNRINRFVRESYSPEGPEEALTTTSSATPVDIYEDEHTIAVKMEVPGIDEKDIDVRIEDTTLTVHGERKIEKEEKEEQRAEQYLTWDTIADNTLAVYQRALRHKGQREAVLQTLVV